MAIHTRQQVPTDPLNLSSQDATDHVDRMLDDAIAESFPSSDPVALAMPHDRIESAATRAAEAAAGVRSAWPLLVVGGVILALLLARRH